MTAHILVCLSSSPSNARIIRSAARTAALLHSPFTGVYVRDPQRKLKADDEKRLQENIALATELGAQVEILEGSDPAYRIADLARSRSVSEIFLGSPPSSLNAQNSLANRLLEYVPDAEIHIIPDSGIENRSQLQIAGQKKRFSPRDLLAAILIEAGATLICWLIFLSQYENANIITVYILASLIVSVVTADRIYGALCAFASFLLFNFLFTEPRFTLLVYDTRYLVTYFVMFMASLIAGTLASRLKENARQASANAARTRILLEFNEDLQEASDEEDCLEITARQLRELLQRRIAFRRCENGKPGELHCWQEGERNEPYPAEEKELSESLCADPLLPGASGEKVLVLPIRGSKHLYALLSVEREGELDSYEDHILRSLCAECSLMLDNLTNARERENALILAENEKFRADLLRSLSHDFRTPLTAISGNAESLLRSAPEEEEVRRIAGDILDDSGWLNEMAENLLAMSRIESTQEIHTSVELAEDLIREALEHADRHKQDHQITLQCEEDLLVEADARLIIQVLINLLNNAIKYTPAGSEIRVEAFREEDKVRFRVIDNGEGISDERKIHLFERFRTDGRAADGSRSLGLGLSLCASIIQAHGETIEVKDNEPHGTIVTFCLKGVDYEYPDR
ncbi:MAG: DUF4118 domain-containing protein [Erysipelotrichaceae bacterium]|nr:DUF4118 domain-containing protein [Erysipelotrichaceae bacterium]